MWHLVAIKASLPSHFFRKTCAPIIYGSSFPLNFREIFSYAYIFYTPLISLRYFFLSHNSRQIVGVEAINCDINCMNIINIIVPFCSRHFLWWEKLIESTRHSHAYMPVCIFLSNRENVSGNQKRTFRLTDVFEGIFLV